MKLIEFEKRYSYFNTLINILEWDRDFVSPKDDSYYKNEVITHLYLERHKYLLNNFKRVNVDNFFAYKILERDYRYSKGISLTLEKEIGNTLASTLADYHRAISQNDYSIVSSSFGKLISLKIEEMESLEIGESNPYTKILEYSCGSFFCNLLDSLMIEIKKNVVPKLRFAGSTIDEKKQDWSIYSVRKLFDKLGVDTKKTVFQVNSSCSCLQLSPHDCRITFHKQSDLRTLKHEIGHVLYMQNIPSSNYRILQIPVSQVIDEAIAILYELFLFEKPLSARCKKTPIRIKAYDLSRLVHLLLRCELERDLFEGNISAFDLNTTWNERFFSYFGFHVPDDLNGVLQDPHWYLGSFGYFPLYILSFCLAGLLSIKINALDNLTYPKVLSLLKEHVFKWGAAVDEKELLSQIKIKDFLTETTDWLSSLV